MIDKNCRILVIASLTVLTNLAPIRAGILSGHWYVDPFFSRNGQAIGPQYGVVDSLHHGYHQSSGDAMLHAHQLVHVQSSPRVVGGVQQYGHWQHSGHGLAQPQPQGTPHNGPAMFLPPHHAQHPVDSPMPAPPIAQEEYQHGQPHLPAVEVIQRPHDVHQPVPHGHIHSPPHGYGVRSAAGVGAVVDGVFSPSMPSTHSAGGRLAGSGAIWARRPTTATLQLHVWPGTKIWINDVETRGRELAGAHRGKRYYQLTGMDPIGPNLYVVVAHLNGERKERTFHVEPGEFKSSLFPFDLLRQNIPHPKPRPPVLADGVDVDVVEAAARRLERAVLQVEAITAAAKKNAQAAATAAERAKAAADLAATAASSSKSNAEAAASVSKTVAERQALLNAEFSLQNNKEAMLARFKYTGDGRLEVLTFDHETRPRPRQSWHFLVN